MARSLKTCGHCGRQAEILGGSQWKDGVHVDLCHVNEEWRKASPDCYHLVTTGQEQLGSRL